MAGHFLEGAHEEPPQAPALVLLFDLQFVTEEVLVERVAEEADRNNYQ